MNKEPENELDFSQYIPNWKGEETNDEKTEFEWNFDEGFEKAIENPEAFFDEENEVKWKHIIEAGKILRSQNNNSTGPYSLEQVAKIVFQIVLQESLDLLVEKKLIKKNPDGTYELTTEGFSEIKEIEKREDDKN